MRKEGKVPRPKKEYKISNFVIIQYMTERGDMKVLAIQDYDIQRLKHRVAIHMHKKVLSIQFYYNVSTNEHLHVIERGVFLE